MESLPTLSSRFAKNSCWCNVNMGPEGVLGQQARQIAGGDSPGSNAGPNQGFLHREPESSGNSSLSSGGYCI
jgi:hypothetical protein